MPPGTTSPAPSGKTPTPGPATSVPVMPVLGTPMSEKQFYTDNFYKQYFVAWQ